MKVNFKKYTDYIEVEFDLNGVASCINIGNEEFEALKQKILQDSAIEQMNKAPIEFIPNPPTTIEQMKMKLWCDVMARRSVVGNNSTDCADLIVKQFDKTFNK